MRKRFPSINFLSLFEVSAHRGPLRFGQPAVDRSRRAAAAVAIAADEERKNIISSPRDEDKFLLSCADEMEF